jgi:predicted dinucleotide-binding enzyme
MSKIGIVGSGVVGETLANGFLQHGDEVMRGSREPAKLAAWVRQAGQGARAGTFAEAAAFGEIVVLAVKGSAAAAALELCGERSLAGKVVIDATNPISEEPPVGGVLRFFTGPNESLMEALQAGHPKALFVKAFSCVGSALMVHPQLRGGPPTMFLCGDDDAAKARVRRILERFGWESEDLGGAAAARAIEPLCILWCIPGFARGDWMHAFKMLRP